MPIQPDNLSPADSDLLKWQCRNRYYYTWLTRIFKYNVRPGSRVLEIGSGTGDLLAAVQPAYGLGIDSDPAAVALAQSRFPHLDFRLADPHSLALSEKFDYVIISNAIGTFRDVQQVLECLRSAVTPRTRIIITYYNYLWEGLLRLGSSLRLRRPASYQNWLAPRDIANLLALADFDLIRTDSYVLFPKNLPLVAQFFNYFLALVPGFRKLNLINLIVARPCPQPTPESDLSVSVIVPCRNERGNIAQAVARIPDMGRHTEIIFIDGNSTDGTAAEIQAHIKANPDRDIKLLHQGAGIGKGDAVRKGFAAASGDTFVIQDADLTAPPEDLPKFFRALAAGKGEYINGSRLVYPLEAQAMRALNLIANKFFSVLFTWLLGQRFRDTLCGTKMIRRHDYDLIVANRAYFGDFDPFGDFDLIFGAVRQNLKVVEVPVTYRARTYGSTNISRFRHGWLLLKMSWIAFKKIKWL
jgi:SAM-dependent methyltransferase